jgi:hypothetical protein
MGLRKKKSLVDQALDQASDYVDALRPHVEAAYGQAKDFVQDTAVPALTDAKDKAVPVLIDARDKAVPVLTDARDKAVPVLTDARAKAAPLVATGAALANEKATAARTLAEAKVAQVKGEKPQKKRSKLKLVALLAVLGGVGAFVAKKLQGGGQSDNWQSSYTPTPAPTATASAVPPAASTGVVDDPAGAGPDEAIADATEAPHEVTTPDDPADVIQVDPDATR